MNHKEKIFTVLLILALVVVLHIGAGEINQLRSRVKELETENQELKRPVIRSYSSDKCNCDGK